MTGCPTLRQPQPVTSRQSYAAMPACAGAAGPQRERGEGEVRGKWRRSRRGRSTGVLSPALRSMDGAGRGSAGALRRDADTRAPHTGAPDTQHKSRYAGSARMQGCGKRNSETILVSVYIFLSRGTAPQRPSPHGARPAGPPRVPGLGRGPAIRVIGRPGSLVHGPGRGPRVAGSRGPATGPAPPWCRGPGLPEPSQRPRPSGP